MKRTVCHLIISLSILVWCSSAFAVFESGSTGLDGPLSFAANSGTQTIVLPDDGVLNYTTIDIPSGVTVVFQKNADNTPVYLLATGDVNISGTINVNGGSTGSEISGKGGPGGFDGGFGGAIPFSGSRGFGPGAGNGGIYNTGPGGGGGYGSVGSTSNYSNRGTGGSTYGNERIYPLIGGSGGGGAAAKDTIYLGGGGGGGGGAIVIASSSSITINGSISARGGAGDNGGGNYDRNDGGGGSGGAIKLVANTVAGNGSLVALGGDSAAAGGGYGRIRIEAFVNNRTASTNPAYTYGEPSSIFMPSPPKLEIVSINGTPVPADAKGAFNQPDVPLPSTTINPVRVEVAATNVPITTNIKVWATPQYGSSTSVSVTPSGTEQSSTALADINISTAYASIITAETTFTVQQAFYIDGEKVEKVYVAGTPGGESEAVYITESGGQINAGSLTASLN